MTLEEQVVKVVGMADQVMSSYHIRDILDNTTVNF